MFGLRESEACDRPSRLARDSFIVGTATVLSRLLGFARDVLIARLLGAGPVADAFLAALRLPNLVRRVLGEGGLNAPFVPLYLSVKAERGEAAARRFAGEAAGQLAVLLIALVVFGEILAPWLVLALAGGFAQEPETLALATHYTRLMLPFLLLTTLASMLAALLNAEKRFAIAALAPALMNAVLLAVLLRLLWSGTEPALGARGLALAVSLTGFAHLALILLALGRRHLPRPSLVWSPEMMRLVQTGGATLLAASSAQIVLLIATQVASLWPGSVSALYYADRVFQLPLSFVGVAMGTVVLSDMAGASGADTQDAMLGRALALGLALALPAATALYVLAEPIVSVLFEYGRFDAADRARAAGALAAFALGLPFAVVAKVFGQAYFVRQSPRRPLIAGLASVLVAAVAGYALAGGPHSAQMAAAAASIAFSVQTAVLAVTLWRDRIWRPRFVHLRPLLASFVACLPMLAALVPLLQMLAAPMNVTEPMLHRLAALAAVCAGGLAVYGAAGWLLGAFGPPALTRHLRKRRG